MHWEPLPRYGVDRSSSHFQASLQISLSPCPECSLKKKKSHMFEFRDTSTAVSHSLCRPRRDLPGARNHGLEGQTWKFWIIQRSLNFKLFDISIKQALTCTLPDLGTSRNPLYSLGMWTPPLQMGGWQIISFLLIPDLFWPFFWTAGPITDKRGEPTNQPGKWEWKTILSFEKKDKKVS